MESNPFESAKRLNTTAQSQEDRAKLIEEVAVEMGPDWAREGWDDDAVAGRFQALLGMYGYAMSLQRRALENRKKAFLDVTE